MNPKIIGIGIAAIVVVAAISVVIFGTSVFATPYWEEEASFGTWRQEIIIGFADGSTESLKIIEESIGRPFTVTYGGRAITSLGVKIIAVVSGTEYTGAELKFESFGVRREIKTLGGVVKKTYDSIRSDGTIQTTLGKSQQILYTSFDLDNTINERPDIYPTGMYIVRFTPIGKVSYRGYPAGGDFKTATLPGSKAVFILVTHPPTGAIVATLSPDVTS